MDLNEIFKSTKTTLPLMLSELVETQCSIKAMLTVILAELADNDPVREQRLVDDCNKCREKELLRVVAIFASWDNKN
ncbi:hypothetical protein [Robiginitalea aurantiaca]|uniref:Uncharacterized protein n=1 Tax=Robiginitalea aurantiaca TaxID=3056915 RepID=A0ABT7WBF2_9FLAO|nr:hypothetical protein [Robiginitalea aurantiaca]MDM9630238.1 hypothetical protein [Robiginitalea aurantiaca]